MAADTQLLMGEVTDNPGASKKNLEQLLAGFLYALLEEQKVTESQGKPNLSNQKEET